MPHIRLMRQIVRSGRIGKLGAVNAIAYTDEGQLLGHMVMAMSLVDSKKIAVACYLGHLQPTFSLWPVSLLESVENAIFILNMRGFMEFLDVHPHQPMGWPKTSPNPFFNINSKEDLVTAEGYLAG